VERVNKVWALSYAKDLGAGKGLRAREESRPRQKAGKLGVRGHRNSRFKEVVVRDPANVALSLSCGVHSVKRFHQKA
jgi:hypothetical protein